MHQTASVHGSRCVVAWELRDARERAETLVLCSEDTAQTCTFCGTEHSRILLSEEWEKSLQRYCILIQRSEMIMIQYKRNTIGPLQSVVGYTASDVSPMEVTTGVLGRMLLLRRKELDGSDGIVHAKTRSATLAQPCVASQSSLYTVYGSYCPRLSGSEDC